MTSKNVQKRNEKAQNLRVIAVDKGTFFVESEEGKICYRVELNSYGVSCTCGDYAKNSRHTASILWRFLIRRPVMFW